MSTPPICGVVTLATDGSMRIVLDQDSHATIDGKAVSEAVLVDDAHATAEAAPTKVAFGTVSFYVIDRETGKLISAEKTGKVTWADKIDLKTGRPVETANIRYEKGPVDIWPSWATGGSASSLAR